uniref:alpha-L-rhamnosidase n=1 Tax=Blastobotrys adeninivorans TaxID=409370 RepID=A0A060T4L7_BLAAD
MTRILAVQVEYHQLGDTIGIGETTPRLSWKIDAQGCRNWVQQKYELLVKSDDNRELYRVVVESEQSTFVDWPGEPLKSRQRVLVSVRAKGNSDKEWSDWSDPVPIETALLDSAHWSAKFIASDQPKSQREVIFSKQFNMQKKSIARARLYSSARGVYEIEINGRKVGHDVLSPGWTSFSHRIIQRTDDVASLLKSGNQNAIGIRLAEGWFSGVLGFEGGVTNVYGDTNMAIAQLEVQYDDGTTDVISTDDSWKWHLGPIISTSLYNGETYDSNEEISGWSSAGLAYDRWNSVRSFPVDVNLAPPVGPPVRCTEVVKPMEIFQSSSGKTIIDFGQNFAGVVRINRVKAPKGHKVTIYHAEVIEDGELGRRPLRLADCVDHYVFNGDPEGEEWQPRFTYHGFRYIQVDNWPGKLSLDSISGIVYHSDFERTGWFECSNKLLNRLHENVRWSMRSNFVSLPTDCPQRDERLGWLGDILLFGPTAHYLYQCQGLLKNWVIDLADEQNDMGVPAVVCPTPLQSYENFWKDKVVAAWQDAAVMVPWHIYEQTGDDNILRAQYDSMSGWLKQVPRDSDGQFWDPSTIQLGDWLDPDAPSDNPAKSKTDAFMVANAYLIQSTEIVAKVATILGYKEDGDKYSKEAKNLRAKFAYEYITPAGRVISQSQTGYALTIMNGLLDGENGDLWKDVSPNKLKFAGDILAEIVERDKCQIGTGFIGTPIICDALTLTGHADLAYKMLLNKKNPSWLYPVTMGATTTWERWDSMLPDGKINPGEMTSFNHYAFGAVASWMHRAIGGLQSVRPGWKKVLIKPVLGGDIDYASTTHESPFGTISSSWKINGSELQLDVALPPNVSGVVVLPGGKSVDIGSGQYSFTSSI